MAVLAARSRDLSADEASALLHTTYGIVAEASPLRSERDQNFLMRAEDGASYVLKLANAVQDPAIATFQTRALLHIAAVDPALAVPRVVATRAGDWEFRCAPEDGAPRIGRLVTFLPGVPLASQPGSLAQAEGLGRLAATLGRALRGFFDPAAGHELLWDLKHAARLADLVGYIDAEADRRLVAEAIGAFRRDARPRLPALRGQVIHNDLNPHNILVDPDRPDVPRGIIDFGDLVFGALINDVAIAAAYLVGGAHDPIEPACRFVAAYHAVTPLDAEEVRLLPVLVATRLAMTCAITAWRAKRYPENEAYIMRNRGGAAAGLETLSAMRPDAFAARLLAACGLE
jgi:Ser/Thr protein kinase RdoA (MazF antagonist)